MAWSDLTTSQLIKTAHNQKGMIRKIIGWEIDTPGTGASTPNLGECPIGATFFVNSMILQQVEKELANRGIPANDPRLGEDILGMMAEVKVDLMSQGVTTW
jgi:hypothetical protein